MRDLFAARRVWRDPPLSTEGFWREKAKVRSFAADERFLRVANLLFQGPDARCAPARCAARRYHAVDLFDWLAALGPQRAGEGDVPHAQQRARRAGRVPGGGDPQARAARRDRDRRRAQPVPDRRSLSHAARVQLARGAGALHQHGASAGRLPDVSRPRSPGRSARACSAATRSRPRASGSATRIRGGRSAICEGDLRSAVTRDLGCVACHRLRGAGGRAGHLRARDAA